MASDEVYQFTISTPAGTLSSAPLVTLTQFPGRIVDRIDWRVPSGALGIMGWQISARNVQIIPKNKGAFIVAHETSGGWDLRNQHNSGDWSVSSYNTGAFPHALYVTYHCRIIDRPAPQLVLADDAGLYGDADPSYAGG